MNFIIQETGEMKEVHFMDKNGCDWATDIAASCGFDRSKFTYDEEKDAFIAPKDEVECWVDFFETYNYCDKELRSLKDRYDENEVDDILGSEIPEFDIDVYRSAVERTKAILQKRYDTATAHLISSYDSNLPKDDWRYFKESLYQRADGSYFLTGEGGPMSGYSHTDELGSLCYGDGSYSITEVHAKAWIANPGAFNSLGVWNLISHPMPARISG